MRVTSRRDLREALEAGTQRVEVHFDEVELGRDTFDHGHPVGAVSLIAKEYGYQVASPRIVGDPPFHGWMGTGTRAVIAELHRTRPSPPPVPLQSPRSSPFPDADPTESDVNSSLDRMRASQAADDQVGVWRTRVHLGHIDPDRFDQESWFWLNALAADAGLQLDRPSFPWLSLFCAHAERALDHTNAAQNSAYESIHHRFHNQ